MSNSFRIHPFQISTSSQNSILDFYFFFLLFLTLFKLHTPHPTLNLSHFLVYFLNHIFLIHIFHLYIISGWILPSSRPDHIGQSPFCDFSKMSSAYSLFVIVKTSPSFTTISYHTNFCLLKHQHLVFVSINFCLSWIPCVLYFHPFFRLILDINTYETCPCGIIYINTNNHERHIPVLSMK